MLLLAFAAPTAGAQEPDPYGSTSSTAPPEEVEASCSISPTQARAGDTVTVTVTGVFFGETVKILVDGVVVATKTAPAAVAQAAAAPVEFGGAALPAQALTTTLVVEFTVPSNLSPGNHAITAVGDTFVSKCPASGIFKVLGSSDGGGGGGSLARTGIYVGLLLAIALALLLAGRAFMASSKRRRRQATMAFHLEDDRSMITPRR